MRLFEKEIMANGQTVFRCMFVAFIQNNVARRALLVVTFLPMLTCNTIISVAFWPVITYRLNRELFKSTARRWKSPRERKI